MAKLTKAQHRQLYRVARGLWPSQIMIGTLKDNGWIVKQPHPKYPNNPNFGKYVLTDLGRKALEEANNGQVR